MKTIGLRSLYKLAPTITEDVLVTHDRRIIGQFTPLQEVGPALVHRSIEATSGPATYSYKEAVMDDTVKKAIEPDQVKENRGKLSKGLGEVPGDVKREVPQEPKPTIQRDPYREFKPVPKK